MNMNKDYVNRMIIEFKQQMNPFNQNRYSGGY